MSDTVKKLLDAAEDSIRLRGYHAVSFRDLADELEIKSASVHYHFRHKEDLGQALVKRYSDSFFASLNAKSVGLTEPRDRIDTFCQVYRQALVEADRICLCAMLAAESCGLPAALAKDVAGFLQSNIDWLVDNLPTDLPASQRLSKAHHILSSLQGAMILSKNLDDQSIIDQVIADLSLLFGSSQAQS
ncbi:MAG: TetR/AcrR family transcriptional regulator [Pseudomonadota bacterium]